MRDYETDLAVVGSVGGGMTAALRAKLEGLDSLILEKTEYFLEVNRYMMWESYFLFEGNYKEGKRKTKISRMVKTS